MDYEADGYFTNLGAAKTGLTVTVDVRNSAGTLVANNQAATELGSGFYTYTYTATVDDTYRFLFKTTSTAVDQQQIATKTDDKTIIGVDVWGYATRTLTQAAASVIAAVTGSSLAIIRGDTFEATITGLGDISSRTKLYFTVKGSGSDADTAAVIQVEETGGLLRLNGAASTTTNGSIVVNNATTGSVTITIKPTATDALALTSMYYDIKMITATTAETLTAGEAVVNGNITRAIT